MSHTPSGTRTTAPHVVIFAGGTASRNLTITLIRRGIKVTRLVPAWDSGGSSKLIRETLHILSVGDIRQALMTMAYAEGHAGDVVRIFNTRLSETGSRAELKRELAFYAEGSHPVLKMMQRDIAEAILRYLEVFMAAAGDDFDWRRGSIGNFILSGAFSPRTATSMPRSWPSSRCAASEAMSGRYRRKTT